MNKNISKILSVFAAAALSSAYTGCATTAAPSDSVYSEEPGENRVSEEIDISEENGGDPLPAESTDGVVFTGILGETLVGVDKFPTLGSDFYIFNDWTYISLTDGLSCNSYDDPDSFDEDGWNEDFPFQENDFFRMDKGDEIGGLVLEEGYTVYCCSPDASYVELEVLSAVFSGELTLSGYLYVAGEDDGYITEDTIVFLADDREWEGLPYIDSDNFFSFGIFGDFTWFAHAPMLLLDYDENQNFDFPKRGSLTHVTATIADPRLFMNFSGALGYHPNTAELIDFEIID